MEINVFIGENYVFTVIITPSLQEIMLLLFSLGKLDILLVEILSLLRGGNVLLVKLSLCWKKPCLYAGIYISTNGNYVLTFTYFHLLSLLSYYLPIYAASYFSNILRTASKLLHLIQLYRIFPTEPPADAESCNKHIKLINCSFNSWISGLTQ